MNALTTTKPVRPKRGHGYRPPDQVVDQRIAECAAILALKPSIHRCELHKLLAPRWVNKDGEACHWKTVDRMVGRARIWLLERSNRPKEAWLHDLIAGYDRDMGDSDPKVRLAARQGFRDLLGMDAPRRTELTGADGAPLSGGNGAVVIVWPHESGAGHSKKATIEVETVKQIESGQSKAT